MNNNFEEIEEYDDNDMVQNLIMANMMFAFLSNVNRSQEELELRMVIEESERDLELRKNESIVLEYDWIEYNKDCKYNSCTICIEDFKEEYYIVKLDCGHLFHEECISEWGLYKQECPVCKKEISHYNK
jgi:hypothetical protein